MYFTKQIFGNLNKYNTVEIDCKKEWLTEKEFVLKLVIYKNIISVS